MIGAHRGERAVTKIVGALAGVVGEDHAAVVLVAALRALCLVSLLDLLLALVSDIDVCLGRGVMLLDRRELRVGRLAAHDLERVRASAQGVALAGLEREVERLVITRTVQLREPPGP